MNLARLDNSPYDQGAGRAAALLRLAPVALWALIELACARVVFVRFTTQRLVARNQFVISQAHRATPTDPQERNLIARIAFVLPRVATRVPWRADCLIQAMAGQSWLLAEGVASQIEIGVENSPLTGFGAHAWLRCGDELVSGGTIERYDLLLGSDAPGVISSTAIS